MIGQDFSDLICGMDQYANDRNYADPDYFGLFHILSNEVSSLAENLHRIISNEVDSDEVVYPYLCRKFLELSTTALLSRVDPGRVLAARKHQKSADYSNVDRNNSAIQWAGDIFPQNPPPKNIWSNDALKNKLERSLLGWHFKESYFSFGFEWVSDTTFMPNSLWIRELSSVDSGFEFIKSKLNKLYSKLSKGVHSEYLVEDRIVFDRESLEIDVCETIMLVVLLSLALNMSPLVLRTIDPRSAADIAMRIESTFLEKKSEI